MWTQWSEWMDVLKKTSPEDFGHTHGVYPDRNAAQSVVTLLKALAQALDSFLETPNDRDCHWVADLSALPRGAATLLVRTLGGGEVVLSLCNDAGTIEETGLRGVWLLRVGGQRSLVAALLPRAVESFIDRGDEALAFTDPPANVSPAAIAVLKEASAALCALRACDASGEEKGKEGSKNDAQLVHQIDLLRQPFGAGDLRYILSVLGTGDVSAVLRGFSRSRIDSTRVRGLWRSRIANTEGRLLFDSLVVARIPREIPAGREDFQKSAQRVRELTAALEDELLHGHFDGH